jgi:hypothetical protein
VSVVTTKVVVVLARKGQLIIKNALPRLRF